MTVLLINLSARPLIFNNCKSLGPFCHLDCCLNMINRVCNSNLVTRLSNCLHIWPLSLELAIPSDKRSLLSSLQLYYHLPRATTENHNPCPSQWQTSYKIWTTGNYHLVSQVPSLSSPRLPHGISLIRIRPPWGALSTASGIPCSMIYLFLASFDFFKDPRPTTHFSKLLNRQTITPGNFYFAFPVLNRFSLSFKVSLGHFSRIFRRAFQLYSLRHIPLPDFSPIF